MTRYETTSGSIYVVDHDAKTIQCTKRGLVSMSRRVPRDRSRSFEAIRLGPVPQYPDGNGLWIIWEGTLEDPVRTTYTSDIVQSEVLS